jgi:Domain of unknown function (DUF222)
MGDGVTTVFGAETSGAETSGAETFATETFDAMQERIASMSGGERQVRLAEAEREMRRLEAELAVLVRSVDQDRSFRSDGHLTAGGFLRSELRWSQQQVTGRLRLGRLIDETPTVVEHLHAGAIGVAQAHAFGKAAANLRCGGQLVDHLELLLRHARSLSFDGFHTAIRAWEHLADADGSNRDAAACHENRCFAMSFFDGVGRIQGQCGALDDEALTKVFEQYQHAEWLADWEAAKERYGEDVAGSMLARTNAQRSWDAFMTMLNDAVSTPPGAQPPEPIVNLVWSEQHAEAQLARSGLIPEPVEPFTNGSTNDWRCETTSGVPVSPFEAMQALIAGRLRRVVFDSAGVVVDFGRLQRLFDSAARKAVLLQFPTCVFPGCNRPADGCEADHLVDWQHGGRTDQRNGGPLCDRHNLLKNRGFTVWRDPNGVFHTYRPDGAEIAPPSPPPGTSPPTIPKAA